MHGINLARFGSYTVGGTIHRVSEGNVRTVSFTRDVQYNYDPKGHFPVGHSYVQFFEPAQRNASPPIVLVHGGGMCGSVWEATPDGREGWVQLLVKRGFECHVVDMVERGRAGFATNYYGSEPISRSMEEAWSLFRIGHSRNFRKRQAFDHHQFPVEFFEEFCRTLLPRWLTTSPLQVTALVALLKKLGRSILISHSQGGEIAFDAASQVPDSVDRILAIEPSVSPQHLDELAGLKVVIASGDYLEIEETWRQRVASWRHLAANHDSIQAVDLPKILGRGNSHLPMIDRNSSEVLNLLLNSLEL